MMPPAAIGGASPASVGNAAENPPDNKLLVSALAFLRAKQLYSGARPRVEPDGHKATHIAVLEVLANAISWELPEAD